MANTQNKLANAIGLLQDWSGDVKSYAEQNPNPELQKMIDMMGPVVGKLRIIQNAVENWKKNMK